MFKLTDFYDEFTAFVDSRATSSGRLLLVGDFNIHVDDKLGNGLAFRRLLEAMNLKQFVNGRTHELGHTLDLVITRDNESDMIQDICLTPLPRALTDHYSVKFSLRVLKPEPLRVKIKCRKLKNVDLNEMMEDVRVSELILSPPSDLNGLVGCYNDTLAKIFDKHAPVTEKEVILRPHAPWYTENIGEAKRRRRRAERLFRQTKLEIHKQLFINEQKLVNDLCSKAKQDYYNRKITEAERDSKELFKLSKQLLCKTNRATLPSHSSCKELANKFRLFFTDKISKITHDLAKDTKCKINKNTVNIDSSIKDAQQLRSSASITVEKLSKIIIITVLHCPLCILLIKF